MKAFENTDKHKFRTDLIMITPLSNENKEFLKTHYKEDLKQYSEYGKFRDSIYEFRRQYINAPWISRSDIKESFREELNLYCDNLRKAVNEKQTDNENDKQM